MYETSIAKNGCSTHMRMFDLTIKQMRFNILLIVGATVLILLIGCTPPKNQNDSELIHINLRGTFPEREIRLEEVANIEFLQLETHVDYLFRGFPQIVTADKIIFAEPLSGNVLVFSRDGRPISRFNRQGGGPEEFPQFRGIVFDEATNEIFIKTTGRIMVYSLTGELLRVLPFVEGLLVPGGILQYDAESLVLRGNVYPLPFTIVSKQDGSVVGTIELPPIEKKLNTSRPIPIPGTDRHMHVYLGHSLVRLRNGFLVNTHATDTVFLYQNRELTPFLVRTPGIGSTPPFGVLSSFFETKNFHFFSFSRFDPTRSGSSIFDGSNLIRDRRTGAIYRQRIVFDDFRGRHVTINSNNVRCSGIGLIRLDLVELQDANDEGRLSGRLREIVEKSEEDGNDVFMLLHFK